MMKRIGCVVRAGAIASAFLATSASAFEFHGYIRDTVGFNSKGGGQVCFQLPGSEFKARLGNECQHYWELVFDETVYKDQTGLEAKVEFMPAYGVDTTTPTGGGTLPTSGTTYGFGTGSVYTQQAWGAIKLPQLGGATVWAGQRYYRRHNVESADWFYWNPYQGDAAAGIEDVDLGFGKLAVSLGRVEAVGTVAAPARVVTGTYMVPEARIYGIAVNPGGAIEIGVDLAIAYDQNSALGANRTRLSPWFTVEHFQDRLLGGFNKLTLQYASGAASIMSSGILSGATSDPKQWRAIEQIVFLISNRVSGQAALVYQDQSNLLNGAATTAASPGSGARIFTAEIRPSYHFTDYFKLQLDAFFQTLSLKDATAITSAANLLKLTVAPTFVAGRGFLARPEIRFFATYGAWNSPAVALASALNTPIASNAFGADKDGTSFGVQVEAWW